MTQRRDQRAESMTDKTYDVLIVGGGVSGTALLYELSRYTDLGRIGLIEKYDDFAKVNSKSSNNSQTIHCGDIETNYTLEKALKVKRTASMLVNYAKSLPDDERDNIIFKYPKMVLGVGVEECEFLRQRFEVFKEHYQGMELLDKEQIAKIEPQVVNTKNGTRPEEVNALAITDDYTAVDYKALSKSFVDQARATDKEIDIHLETCVSAIEKCEEGHKVIANNGEYRARFVVVSAGGHSLLLAQQMGYGLNFSCLPVAGSFYFTPQVLTGKVYTVQNDKLPFAAIHGDPDVRVPGKTRFGPTALLLPMLERYNSKTIPEFFKVLRLDGSVFKVFWDLFKVSDIRNYIFKNFLFEIPWVRRRLFLKDARKIVPGLELKDVEFAKGYGGIRPQLIDKDKKELLLGEARINPGTGIIFNMTPSPGGTSCLGNAENDLRIIIDYLGCNFDENRFNQDLLNI
ncbi:FAD-dependent oxidoreductase [Sansalvadorimonas sp. 2012CJ34-2]|uniref:FAD-dependent oxidoreductase n=1 Tax=Parendozoicomonas callyspongiae TaxID=2942213 RepID=A0ABT0PC77_9GAMM|nr:FAD-dependent oxidoreductase [Sansalvadorimonas sp. 2012CJ34-2]MCL6268949.1 FAD-dependent oxidoreductase [Sansalvadorimonas sp. 2012CJ34-2]